MNKTDKNNLLSNASLGASTVLGVTGVITGNPIIQAFAYTPSVIEKMILGISSKNECIEKELENELHTVVESTCKETEVRLKEKSTYLAAFFHYVSPRIEAEYKNGFSIPDMIEWLRKDIEIDKKHEAAFLTDIDINSLLEEFIQIFIEQLLKYPKLGQYLNLQTIFNHEKRIQNLEKSKFYRVAEDSKKAVTSYMTYYHDDTESYSEKYCKEALFLHKDLPEEQKMYLENIFVMPKAINCSNEYFSPIVPNAAYEDISKALEQFVNYSPHSTDDKTVDFLFIEGQAAMGKSSLIAWLAWNYLHNTDASKAILNKKKLIVIRLRDMLSESISLDIQAPLMDIYRYLIGADAIPKRNPNSIGKNLLKDTVLVLDGFDELCMVESISSYGKEAYFYNMYRAIQNLNCRCKIIVTTRPNYLNISRLDFPKLSFTIDPFSYDKRQLWVNKYEAKQSLSEDIKNSLLKEQNPQLECLLETPLVLYMVAAKNISLNDSTHIWDIYNRIFSKEIYERNYEESVHSINQYKKALYELTTEIAYAVSGEQHFFITVEKLLEKKDVQALISNLDELKGSLATDRDKMQEILSDCFGVASYFKVSPRETVEGINKIALEFYHNNIKDYFCCEYIWRNLEKIYQDIPKDTLEMEKRFIISFQKMFQFSVFMKEHSANGAANMVVQFFKDKVLYMKEKAIKIDFIEKELKHNYFSHFFGKMLETGILHHYEYDGKENIIDMMVNIYSSILPIYQGIYQPSLNPGETISLAKPEYVNTISNSSIFMLLFTCAHIYNQTYLGFDEIALRGIAFGTRDFRHASFKYCPLVGCDFNDCDLRGANFQGADLSDVDFRNAKIDETTCFKDATFADTLVDKIHLDYIEPQKEGALIVLEPEPEE